MSDYSLLAKLVWELRFLSMAAQVAHWRVFGPTSYSDHLLFGRVYEKLDELLDPLAERLTAFSQFDDEKYVDLVGQAAYVYSKSLEYNEELRSALLDSTSTALFFYEKLRTLTSSLRGLAEEMQIAGYLTYGLEDLLASTADELETLSYFLERRTQVMQGPNPPPALTELSVLPPAFKLGPCKQ